MKTTILTLTITLLLAGCVATAPRIDPIVFNESTPVTQDQLDACLVLAKAASGWKDGESVRFENEHTWGTYYNKKMLYVGVNAKNSFGAYVGTKLAGCLADADNKMTEFCFPIYQACR